MGSDPMDTRFANSSRNRTQNLGAAIIDCKSKWAGRGDASSYPSTVTTNATYKEVDTLLLPQSSNLSDAERLAQQSDPHICA